MLIPCNVRHLPIYKSNIFIINALFEGMTCSGGFWNNDDELVDSLQDVYVFWTSISIVLAMLIKYQYLTSITIFDFPSIYGNSWARLFDTFY